ncbi:MAG TPA: condensation domain-containing protein, partial [Cytophagales bacterium]
MKNLLKEIRDNNILLEVAEGKLKLFTDNPRLDQALLARIKAHKDELIQFLAHNDQALSGESAGAAIPVAPEQSGYPLSSAQSRLYVLSQFGEGNAAYNIPAVHVFTGELNQEALDYAFGQLVVRHQVLRTAFREDGQGEVKQYVLPAEKARFTIHRCDLRQEDAREETLGNLVAADVFLPFDLAAGPLMRASLFQVADRKWVFAYTMHHLISDGWSMKVLIKDLLQLYNAYTRGDAGAVPPLR